MSFHVRQISRTSDGREIVRTTAHSDARISVGRAVSCDVHLPDLSVDLNHANITQEAQEQVRIAAVGDNQFYYDGHPTKSVSIVAADGGELKFGAHRLLISRDGSDIVITVERIEALSNSAVDKDEAGLFTLRHQLFSRRTGAWGLVIAVSCLFLIWPLYSFATFKNEKIRPVGFHADTMWSSGPLSISHKSLENDCQACHNQGFVTVTDNSCLTCHKDDAHAHADPKRVALSLAPPGIFGTIGGYFRTGFNVPAGRCVECHTEHEGAGKMQPTAQKFCTDCHASLDTRLTDTKLPNAGDFGTQHPQFRPAIVTDTSGAEPRRQRISLDARPREHTGLKFPHAVHLSKTNGIARMAQTMAREQGYGNALACKDCHTPSVDGTRFMPVDMESDCQMCHSLAFDNIGGTLRTLRHGEPAQVIADLRAYYRSTTVARPINLGGMVRRRPGDYSATQTAQDYQIGVRAWPGQAEGAVRAVFSKGGACYDCHVITPSATTWSIRKIVQPDRYMLKGWFDHNAHKGETCQSCHAAERSNLASDVLLPDQNSCRTCHVGEGGASLHAVKQPVESSCAMCHDYHVDDGAPWRTKTKVNDAKGKPRFAAIVVANR